MDGLTLIYFGLILCKLSLSGVQFTQYKFSIKFLIR